MHPSAVNIVSLQVGWFACILGAAWGKPAVGPIIVALLIAAHLKRTPMRFRSSEVRLIAAAGALGYVADSVLVLAGVIRFESWAGLGWPSTLWMAALWMNLATAFQNSLRWLSGRYVLGAVLGSFLGPFAYWAGERLGAVVLQPDLRWALAAVAVEWMIAIPTLLWLAGWTRSWASVERAGKGVTAI